MTRYEDWLRQGLDRCTHWATEAELLGSEVARYLVQIDPSGCVSGRNAQEASLAMTGQVDGRIARWSKAYSGDASVWGSDLSLMQRPSFLVYDDFFYALNGPTSYDPVPTSAFRPDSWEDLAESAQDLWAALVRQWPELRISTSLTCERKSTCLVNSLGLSGEYERTQTGSAFHFFHPISKRSEVLRYKSIPSAEEVIESCRDLLSQVSHSLPPLQINRGTSSLVISPWIAELISVGVAAALSIESRRDERLLSQLPPSFHLSDDPSLEGGPNRVPFDDEGTPTRPKVLCDGPKVGQYLSHLASAARCGERSSGNGFRRSPFLESSCELAPSIVPTNLMLKPGSSTIEDVLKDQSEVVVLENVLFPFSKMNEFVERSVAMCFSGKVYKDGNPVALLSGQHHPGVKRVAQPKQSHGSLLDPEVIALRSGSMTYSGWFPYLYLPRFTWG